MYVCLRESSNDMYIEVCGAVLEDATGCTSCSCYRCKKFNWVGYMNVITALINDE